MRWIEELLQGTYDPADLVDTTTRFGHTLVYEVQDDEGDILRVLEVEGTWQSASYVDDKWSELTFGYHNLFDVALDMLPSERRTSALMLGGGALSYPKHVLTHEPGMEVHVVEVDPKIVQIAKEWFFLDRLTATQRSRLTVHCDDARSFLEAGNVGGSFDLIVNDLFAARHPETSLMEESGMRLVRQWLADDGIYVANVVSALKGRRAKPLKQVVGALSRVFSHVAVIALGLDEPRSSDNNVVIAWDGPYAAPDGSLSPEELELA